jgi:hypothetical protein
MNLSRLLRHGLVAAVVMGLGAALWVSGRVQSRGIDARRSFLVMQYAPLPEQFAGLERSTRFVPEIGGVARWRARLREGRAAAQYWLGRYPELTAPGELASDAGTASSGSPGQLLIVANAAYRQAAGELNEQTPPERFDGIARLYLDALESDAELVDAAYNYEFVVRLRNQLARERTARRRPRPGDGDSRPPAPSLHGAPGAAPPDADLKEFKVIVPQRPEERSQQPDAGVGGGKVRKG